MSFFAGLWLVLYVLHKDCSLVLCIIAPSMHTCFYLLQAVSAPLGRQSIWHCGLALHQEGRSPVPAQFLSAGVAPCYLLRISAFQIGFHSYEPFQHNTALRCHLDWAGDSDRSVSLLIHSLFCILKSSTEGAVTVCEKRLLRSDYSLSFHDFHTQVKSVFSPL